MTNTEKNYFTCHVTDREGEYEFWDGTDSNGEYHFGKEEYRMYRDDGNEMLIPLPDSVYHAVAYDSDREADFLDRDGDNILNRTDPIDTEMLQHQNTWYMVFVYYDHHDLEYALETLETHFSKQRTESGGTV